LGRRVELGFSIASKGTNFLTFAQQLVEFQKKVVEFLGVGLDRGSTCQ
jgi:hypothetical protein